MKLTERARFATICLHAGQTPDPSTGAIITPIFQTATYAQEEVGKHKGFEYARTQNPTRAAVEANLAAIEGGRAAFAFASGMSAINAIAARLASGDHVIVTDNTYGGTFRLFDKVLRRYGLTFSYVDTSDLGATERAFTPQTKLVFVETPTNPVHADHGPLRSREDGAQPRRVAGRGQHVREPVPAAPARVWRRPGRPQHDQVPQRPQRLGGRGRRREPRRGHRVAALHPERRRRDPEPVRFLAGVARHQDAAAPHGPALGQRHGARARSWPHTPA